MFFHHVIGYYHPIVSIKTTVYDPGNREFYWGSSTQREATSITERGLKEKIYDKVVKDPVAGRPMYEPNHLELGDLLVFDKDGCVVGYAKLDDIMGVRLPKG